jgi:hypothetical protein
MSDGGFYVAAVLIVLSCLAAVLLRGPLTSAVAAAAVAVSVGIFLVVAHEYLLAVLEMVALLATLLVVLEMARRGSFGSGARSLPLSRWLFGAVLAILTLVVLDGTALAAGRGWFRSGVMSGLGSVLQHHAPVTVGFLIVAGAAAVLVSVVIGRTSSDEAEFQRRLAARREREERMERRRQDRAAARRLREGASPGGGG